MNQPIYQNSYTSLDWDNLRTYIFNGFIKKYFPNTYNNFRSDLQSDTLIKMLVESYVAIGDIINFNVSDVFKETNLDTAEQESNIWALAKQSGYMPKLVKASSVKSDLGVVIPADANYLPDYRYAPIIRAGSEISSTKGQVFYLTSDTPMSGGIEAVYKTDSNNNPTFYALKQEDCLFKSGGLTTYNYPINSFTKFRRVTLPEANVVEVLDAYDSRGNKYFQVNSLSQDVIFERVTNSNSDLINVPYILNMRRVPYRFMLDVDPVAETTSLVFGSGNSTYETSDLLVPNPAMFAIDFTDENPFMAPRPIIPEMLTGSMSLGISPETDITIRYRIGGGKNSNVAVGEIQKVSNPIVDFLYTDLDPRKTGAVKSSLVTKNRVPADGGGDKDDLETVKYMARLYENSQARLVSPEDFIVKVFSMPPSLGSIAKVSVEPINDSNTIRMYALSQTSDGYLLSPSQTLLENIRNWIGSCRLMAEGIELVSGEIVNLKCKFRVVVDKRVNALQTLYACITAIKPHLAITNMQMGKPIIISEIYEILHQVPGVYAVDGVEIVENFIYGNYPTITNFKVSNYLKNNVLYIPPQSCAEFRNLDNDIEGSAI